MILTSKDCLGSNIWPKILEKSEKIERIISTTWNIEAIYKQKASGRPNCLLSLTGKEVRHMHALLFCD